MPSRTQTNLSSSGIGLRRAVGQAIGAASGVGPVGGGAVPAPLLTNLVAYWDLDESSGARADSGPNGYTLTDNNTVGSAAGVGAGQTAADFTAANSETLSVASAPGLQLAGDRTFTFWLRPDTVAGTQIALSKDDGQPGGPGREWVVQSDTSRVSVFVFDSVSGFVSINAEGGYVVDTWAFITFQYNAATKKARISVNNGAFSETAALTNAAKTGATPLVMMARTTAALFADGKLQAVGAWSRLLSSDELTFLYNSGTAARLYSDVAAYTG